MNSDMPKVSVVTLVYNVESYMEKCVRSLMEQTLEDVEFIFIDDCSMDDSISILNKVLDDYPHRKGQVKLCMNEVNRGSAYCRNVGLQLATGEYIISCDSDDWVEKDAYERMYDVAKRNDADIVLTDFFQNYPGKEFYIRQKECFSNAEYVNGLLDGSLHGSTWNKLVRKTLYEKFDISYEPEINLMEDLLINIRLFLVSEKVIYLPTALYHYWRGNAGSYTRTRNMQILEDQLRAIDFLEHILETHGGRGYERSLCLLKLRVKASLLVYSRSINERRLINSLYPEACPYISLCSNISVLWRILLHLSYYNEVCISTLIILVGRKLKHLKNK